MPGGICVRVSGREREVWPSISWCKSSIVCITVALSFDSSGVMPPSILQRSKAVVNGSRVAASTCTDLVDRERSGGGGGVSGVKSFVTNDVIQFPGALLCLETGIWGKEVRSERGKGVVGMLAIYASRFKEKKEYSKEEVKIKTLSYRLIREGYFLKTRNYLRLLLVKAPQRLFV